MTPSPTLTNTLTTTTTVIGGELFSSKQEKMIITEPTTTPTLNNTKGKMMLKSTGKSISGKIGEDPKITEEELMKEGGPLKVVWRNVILFMYLHAAALVGFYLLITLQVKWQTFIWAYICYAMGGLGITAGAHRLWSHKSYKAHLPLRLLLTAFQTIAFQNDVIEWSRDHRVHHKYSETHADPHNAKRGFFFAHMGWLLCRKHEAVKVKGKGIDMSDLESDSILQFQRRFYLPLVLILCFILPTMIPWFFWSEKFTTAWFFATQFRYCFNLHATWLVNSAAHMWGNRPYDKTINPSQNKTVAVLALGEGWHNYHHAFPWDYKTAELGYYKYNMTTLFIDCMSKIGWAYDCKSVPKDIVLQRVKRTGDGSLGVNWSESGHFDDDHHHDHPPGPWGWTDKDIPQEDIDSTITLYPKKDN